MSGYGCAWGVVRLRFAGGGIAGTAGGTDRLNRHLRPHLIPQHEYDRRRRDLDHVERDLQRTLDHRYAREGRR